MEINMHRVSLLSPSHHGHVWPEDNLCNHSSSLFPTMKSVYEHGQRSSFPCNFHSQVSWISTAASSSVPALLTHTISAIVLSIICTCCNYWQHCNRHDYKSWKLDDLSNHQLSLQLTGQKDFDELSIHDTMQWSLKWSWDVPWWRCRAVTGQPAPSSSFHKPWTSWTNSCCCWWSAYWPLISCRCPLSPWTITWSPRCCWPPVPPWCWIRQWAALAAATPPRQAALGAAPWSWGAPAADTQQLPCQAPPDHELPWPLPGYNELLVDLMLVMDPGNHPLLNDQLSEAGHPGHIPQSIMTGIGHGKCQPGGGKESQVPLFPLLLIALITKSLDPSLPVRVMTRSIPAMLLTRPRSWSRCAKWLTWQQQQRCWPRIIWRHLASS